MSQVSKKVKWCLNKANRELAESGLHRGLVKRESEFDRLTKMCKEMVDITRELIYK